MNRKLHNLDILPGSIEVIQGINPSCEYFWTKADSKKSGF